MSVYFPEEPQDNTDNKRLDLEKKMSSEEVLLEHHYQSTINKRVFSHIKASRKFKTRYFTPDSRY